MLVTQRHQYDTIGGGHLEWQAAQKARAWLDEALPEGMPTSAQARYERIALGASLGQCCGGVVELRYDRLDAYSNLDYAAFLRELQQQQPTLPRLYLFGAGHVARALVQVLEQTPCDIIWIDEREDLFPTGLPAHITIEATDTPEALIAAAPAGSHFLVMTHHHGLDLRLTEQILRRSDSGWFGLIGSRTKRASFSHRLIEKGITSSRLQSMVCPIGLPEIQGKEPGVIAVAVAAQLWQVWSQQRQAGATEKLSDVSHSKHSLMTT
jgi:xanthine dehydrogenase accessory factor